MFPHDVDNVHREARLERYEAECIKFSHSNIFLNRENKLALNRLRENLQLTTEEAELIHKKYFPVRKANRLKQLALLPLGIVVFGLPAYYLMSVLHDTHNIPIPHSSTIPHSPTPEPKVEVKGTYTYGGSTTWAAVNERVNPDLLKAHPDFKLKDSLSGSSNGIKSLLDETSDLAFAVSSRPLRDEEKAQGLKEIPIAIDGIALAVRKDLNITSLTLDELKGIYLSSIRNWQDLNTPDSSKRQNWKIVPYIRLSGGSTDVFEDTLGVKRPGVTVASQLPGKSNPSTTDILQAIAEDEQNQRLQSGIYPASASEIVDQCSVKPLSLKIDSNSKAVAPFQQADCDPSRPLGERRLTNTEAFQKGVYPLTRRIYVVVNPKKTKGTQAGYFYAGLLRSPQGQQLLEKAGFSKLP